MTITVRHQTAYLEVENVHDMTAGDVEALIAELKEYLVNMQKINSALKPVDKLQYGPASGHDNSLDDGPDEVPF